MAPDMLSGECEIPLILTIDGGPIMIRNPRAVPYDRLSGSYFVCGDGWAKPEHNDMMSRFFFFRGDGSGFING